MLASFLPDRRMHCTTRAVEFDAENPLPLALRIPVLARLQSPRRQWYIHQTKWFMLDCHVETAGGYVTVRVNTGALRFETESGQPIDLLASVESLLQAGAVGVWTAAVKAEIPVPTRKTDEAIEHTKDCSAEGKEATGRNLALRPGAGDD